MLEQGIFVEGIYHKNRNNILPKCRSYPVSHIGRISNDYDAVFMVAAAIPYRDIYVSDVDLLKANVKLPLQIALQFPNSFIVFASSVYVYGNL